jgi:DNA-binding IscR family transcriptional regulator
MIPKTAEYALRALVLLARALERPLSAEEIARIGLLPRRYANKVLHALVRAGFVRSKPGRVGVTAWRLNRSVSQSWTSSRPWSRSRGSSAVP